MVTGPFVGIHPDQLRTIIRLGEVSKTRPGYVNLGEACRGIVRHYKGKVAASTNTAGKSRVADARADEIRQRIAEKNRERVPLMDANAALDIVVARVRDEIRGLGARVTRDPELQRLVTAEANATLTRIAEALTVSAKFLRDGGELPFGSPDDAHHG